MKIRLVTITPESEKVIAYIARVSNPNNQDNPDYAAEQLHLENHCKYQWIEVNCDTTAELIAFQELMRRALTEAKGI